MAGTEVVKTMFAATIHSLHYSPAFSHTGITAQSYTYSHGTYIPRSMNFPYKIFALHIFFHALIPNKTWARCRALQRVQYCLYLESNATVAVFTLRSSVVFSHTKTVGRRYILQPTTHRLTLLVCGRVNATVS